MNDFTENQTLKKGERVKIVFSGKYRGKLGKRGRLCMEGWGWKKG
jgi:hypothetical protein